MQSSDLAWAEYRDLPAQSLAVSPVNDQHQPARTHGIGGMVQERYQRYTSSVRRIDDRAVDMLQLLADLGINANTGNPAPHPRCDGHPG